MAKKTYRILVVDDEPAITFMLGKILENHGYETATANSGEEAVSMAYSFQPDLMLSRYSNGKDERYRRGIRDSGCTTPVQGAVHVRKRQLYGSPNERRGKRTPDRGALQANPYA